MVVHALEFYRLPIEQIATAIQLDGAKAHLLADALKLPSAIGNGQD